jgi:two-component system CheB/CheR fusion protein
MYGEQLIAVILTGNGTDGAAGGTGIIQNPETAPFPAMPLSLAPTDVDIIAHVENIGAILIDLISGIRVTARPTEERALRTFLDQLRERSGIDFNSYKMPTIMRRLQRRMVATGSERLTDYIRYLQGHNEEYQRLVSSFLIKVTEFFRDAELFSYLRDHVLPELIAEARNHDNELRFWSAGCATGEEAYSLAILVSDLLGEDLDRFNVRIFATDLDNDAVTFARRGIYPASTLANVPQDMVDRYFTRVNGEFEIRKQVRALTVFGQHDLGQRAPFPRIDVALCRNVLIYFTTELQKRALQLFAFSLRDNGFLVLGKAETTSPLGEYFALEHPQLKIYRRQGDRILIPLARIRDTAPILPIRAVTNPRLSPQIDPVRMQRDTQRALPAREVREYPAQPLRRGRGGRSSL